MEAHVNPNEADRPLKIDMIRNDAALKQFSTLLDKAFCLPAGSHYLDDFPVWDERCIPSGADLLKIGAFDGDLLVSSVAIRMAELKDLTGGIVPIAIVGAVATDEAWRGRGLASKTVSLALEWAVGKRAALAVLWGSEHSLYGKLGFLLRGKQVRVPLAGFQGLGSVAVQTGWTDALFPLLKARPQGLRLREADLAWVRAHKNVKWFWTGDPGKPNAYAALGKGIDLAGMIHEWGGARKELVQLFAAIEREHPGSELLGSPTLMSEQGILPPESSEPLCLAKVLEPGRAPQDFWLWGLDSA